MNKVLDTPFAKVHESDKAQIDSYVQSTFIVLYNMSYEASIFDSLRSWIVEDIEFSFAKALFFS